MPSRLTLAVLLGIAVAATARAQDAPVTEAASNADMAAETSTEPQEPPLVAPQDAGTSPAAPSQEAVPAKVEQESTPPESSPHRGGSPHSGLPDAITGLPIWNNIQLHGRFDLNYERDGYTGNPFTGGYDALKNYHHFLFLVRDSKDDPITFNIELITQQWYEIAYRIAPANSPWRFLAKAGRILVPFGSDPLYHHFYGGRAGFDQQLLSVVWSQLGAAFNAQYRWQGINFSDDVYAVQGYKLPRADAVLNLQSDFSTTDDLRFGVGNRFAVAYGPLAVYYSSYFNDLGFGRHMFMQAVDVSLARFHGIPILEHFTLDFGVIRADVAGGASRGYGGPNDDYYHFADYVQVRYYPFYWLYVQLRTGIKTINNKRGVYIDRSDLTVADTISHNIGIVARYRGLSAGLYQFWNIERANEIANDLVRLAVIYEF